MARRPASLAVTEKRNESDTYSVSRMKSITSEQMRRRWLALGVVALAYILSFFQRFAPAGVAPDLASAFQTSAASLGVLAATYFYVYTLMQIPTGILADTLGPRRILAVGGVVAGAGSFLFGLAPTLDLALIGRTLIGLGVSVTFIAMLKLIAVWFEENRFATLVGVGMLIGNLGSVLAGAPLSAVAQATGWRGVFIGVGVLSLVLAALCWLVVRDMARPVAASRLSLWFGGFAVGCLLLGTLSDRLGRRKPVIIVASHLYVAIWVLLLAGVRLPVELSYALFAALGVTTAGFSLTWACAKEVNPPMLSGMSTSVTNMGSFLAAALFQPLVGWVMDMGWKGEMVAGVRVYDLAAWRGGLAVAAALALVGAICSWWIVETRCRNVWKA